MRTDLVTAWRQVRRAPGTALAAILTLAIGIGATTAVFSFVTAVMSAASPAPDMDRLVGLWSHNRGESETKGLVSPADYLDWSERARSFSATAAWRGASFNLSGDVTPARVSATSVTPGYFEIFGWRPVVGRLFVAADARPGAPLTLVASHAFWQNTLGGGPDAIGKVLKLDGQPATVVGVLPRLPGLTGFFVPMELATSRADRSARSLFVMARLGPGVSIDAARAEMDTIGESLEREFPVTNRGWSVNTRPLQEEFVGSQARLIFALLVGTVLAVLLIGCVNIANLLLARGVSRRGELAVRLALGAGGWRIVRQLLVECALLAGFGALASLAVSRWTINLLMTLGSIDSPWIANGGLNVRTLLLTSAFAMLATVAAGLAPALSARRGAIVDALRAAGRSGGPGTRRMTRVLVAAQVTLAVTLLVAAGLATRTLVALEQLEPGFDIDNVLTAAVTLPDAMPEEAAARWIGEAVARASQMPGVVVAGATSRLPFAGSRWNPNRGLEVEGQPATDGTEGRWAVDYTITPGLLESLRIGVVEGRVFSESDGAGAPAVAIVNEAMARRFWPDGSPLGSRIRQSTDAGAPWRTVVGVVANVRNDDADQPPLPYLYVPFAQRPARTFSLAVRTSSDPEGYADSLRRAIAGFDSDQPLYDVRSMRQVWEADLANTRMLIRVMAALAVIALGLAGLGVWGVAAQSVGQRTREIGVRVALGATSADIGRLIAWQGLIPIGAGLVTGLAGGLALGRAMRSILFQVTPTDPMTLFATLAVLALVGFAATLGPAISAARLDPVAALRGE